MTPSQSVAAWKPALAPRKPAIPEVSGSFVNPIDRFAAAYFQQRGQTFSPVVADAVFARRVYLDVWGLLPTPTQLAHFLKDTQSNKRDRLVDELLSDR